MYIIHIKLFNPITLATNNQLNFVDFQAVLQNFLRGNYYYNYFFGLYHFACLSNSSGTNISQRVLFLTACIVLIPSVLTAL